MNPLAPEFTRNLVGNTARVMAGMDRVMRPGGIATPEGLSAAFRAGMQHLAAHKGDVATAIASAKAAAAVRRDSAPEVAVTAKAEVAKAAVHHEPAAAAADYTLPQAEHPSEPGPIWHGLVPTAQSSVDLPGSVARFVSHHPLAALAVLGTEIIGGGPEDPAADGAAAAEIALAEGAAGAAASEAAIGATSATESVAGGAANRAAFEAYKNSLRAAMERPATSDPGLTEILERMYRVNATVGSGSTAAAVRQELLTGQPVRGAFHSQKAAEYITVLIKWLQRNPSALPGDRAAAENVLQDLKNALRGE